jgi:hypothetical protein
MSALFRKLQRFHKSIDGLLIVALPREKGTAIVELLRQQVRRVRLLDERGHGVVRTFSMVSACVWLCSNQCDVWLFHNGSFGWETEQKQRSSVQWWVHPRKPKNLPKVEHW